LDLWLAESDKPTPLVVNFHGGGFRIGDKKSFRRNSMLKNLSGGVSFASVNYPFIDQVGGDHRRLLKHCAESIRFLKKNAAAYNIDENRFSIMGNSAGALISGYLGHAEKLGIRSLFPIQQAKGTPHLIPYIRADGPPIVVYNRSGLHDEVHNPKYAVMLRTRCEELGVKCIGYGVEHSGLKTLPKDKDINDLAMKFFRKSWKN
jgi:predicted esterase